MRFFLKGYLTENLGDDLFFDIIFKRYQKNENIKFDIIAPIKYRKTFGKDIKVYPLNCERVLKRIIGGKYSIERRLQKEDDATILVGGSMFIENKNEKIDKYKRYTDKPYYILGANFGPYQSKTFKEYYLKFFENITDICFRDKKSFSEFSQLTNVRMAPDIVFSSNFVEPKKIEERKVLFSIIDCEKKQGQIGFECKNEYRKIICNLIEFFLEQKYEITLMSFCKSEGDEKEINYFINKYKNKSNLKKYFYKNNIEEAIDVINNQKIIVGTRFHANILGLKLRKTILPISYNNKTINMLNDINYNGKIIDLKNIEKFKMSELTENDLNYVCKIDDVEKKSIEHFKELDKFIEGYNE